MSLKKLYSFKNLNMIGFRAGIAGQQLIYVLDKIMRPYLEDGSYHPNELTVIEVKGKYLNGKN